MKQIIVLLFMLASSSVFAQTPPPPAPLYGESISLENARKVLHAAQAYALSKQWTVVVAIVDTGGNLVALEKIDNTQIASIEVAIGKAKTANNFKRPTKALEDAIAGGGVGLRVLSLPGAVPIEGGELILVNGKIVGAIGISGMSAAQDGEVAKAGVAALK
ncbi:MAG TPA: heme-binding protein [Cyclobacteriaceae bacterium]|nr:heme-binding protein [Cyclobacteriaceae bacterium]